MLFKLLHLADKCNNLTINNGNVELTQNRVGAVALLNCDLGFTLVGSGIRRCLSNGQWSGTQSICTRK